MPFSAWYGEEVDARFWRGFPPGTKVKLTGAKAKYGCGVVIDIGDWHEDNRRLVVRTFCPIGLVYVWDDELVKATPYDVLGWS